jgi:DNA helicase IV
MKSHLKENFQLGDIHVRTVHSLGYSLARSSPRYRNGGVVKEIAKAKFMKECLALLPRKDRDFALSLLYYSNAPEKQREAVSFQDREKYYEYLRRQMYRTLDPDDGEVKSIAERDIANFLYLNQVEYANEEFADWADQNSDYHGYHPDFYLPFYKLYIEHWATDRFGKVPDWFESRRYPGDPSREYEDGKKWKLDQFRIHGRNLVETDYEDWREERLSNVLTDKLLKYGVKLRPLSHEAIVEKAQCSSGVLRQLSEICATEKANETRLRGRENRASPLFFFSLRLSDVERRFLASNDQSQFVKLSQSY